MLDCFIHPTMCFAFAWILSYTKVYQMLDWLWFIHPTMCFALVFALILSYIKVDEMFDWLWFIHPVFCLCFCFNVLNQSAGDAWLLLLYSSHNVFLPSFCFDFDLHQGTGDAWLLLIYSTQLFASYCFCFQLKQEISQGNIGYAWLLLFFFIPPIFNFNQSIPGFILILALICLRFFVQKGCMVGMWSGC